MNPKEGTLNPSLAQKASEIKDSNVRNEDNQTVETRTETRLSSKLAEESQKAKLPESDRHQEKIVSKSSGSKVRAKDLPK